MISFSNAWLPIGSTPSWEPAQCPAVFSGPDSVRGQHRSYRVAGKTRSFYQHQILVCLQDEYCSDLQRGYYVLRQGETQAPPEVAARLRSHPGGCPRVAGFMKAGVTGFQVDQVARDYVISQGYPSWDYALGHQVGRAAHDGGTLLGPRLERYNNPELIDTPLEEGNIFTLELGVPTSHGWVGLEEMVSVHTHGVKYLVPMQSEIFLIPAY